MTATNNNHVFVFTGKPNSKPVPMVSKATLEKAKAVAAKYAPKNK